MSQLPASAVRTLRPQVVKPSAPRITSALGPGPVPSPAPVPPPAKTHDLDVIGPRKLIRPALPGGVTRGRFQRQEEPALSARATAPQTASHESSHAEAFYLQKQVQAQTPMVLVLDDGEQIEGCIEWYDRNVIKVRAAASPLGNGRSGARILVYKSSIKYLYKSGENQL